MLLRTANLLSLCSFAVCLLVGCGGSSDPAPVAPVEDVASPESNDNLAPPDISMPDTPQTEGGPGTGSEFDVPPDLGNPSDAAEPSEPAEPEFKLPPASE